ncbi:MFS transporter [Tsukamurella serpentis]
MFRVCVPERPRFPVAALWAVFFLNGAVLSSWAPRIPEVAYRLDPSDVELGAALFGVAAGSVPALLVAGHWLRTDDSTTMCLASASAFASALVLVGSATTALQLGLVLALLGTAAGVLDVSMNTAAIAFQNQRRSGPVISRLHGGYSLGVLAGAAGGAAATIAGIPVQTHFLAVSGVLLVLLFVAGGHLPRIPAQARRRAAPRTPMGRVITFAVAALAIAGLLLEGLLTDWAALVVSRDLGAGTTVGSTVVVAFSLAMFVSRSVGDWIVPRLGRLRYLVVVAIGSAVGTSVGVLIPGWVAGYVGIVIAGLVLGPVFPLAISVATERATGPASATAAVSAIGYTANLAGPPLIGSVSVVIGLPTTISLFGIGCAAAIAGAGISLRLRETARSRDR